MKNKLQFLFIILLFTSFVNITVSAQKRVMIQGADVIEKRSFAIISSVDYQQKQVYAKVPSTIVNFFANNKKFTIIDRQNIQLINQEKELQKSENFIDGFIVDQGKSEGVEYVIKPIFYQDEKKLIIKVYDVATGSVKYATERILDTSFLSGVKDLSETTTKMMREVLIYAFDIKHSFVRTLKDDDTKPKLLLFALGYNHKVIENDPVFIYVLEQIDVDGEMITKIQSIAKGSIKKVEDANFSHIELKSGHDKIKAALAKGEKFFVTPEYID